MVSWNWSGNIFKNLKKKMGKDDGNFYTCEYCGEEFFISWEENECQCSGCIPTCCSDKCWNAKWTEEHNIEKEKNKKWWKENKKEILLSEQKLLGESFLRAINQAKENEKRTGWIFKN